MSKQVRGVSLSFSHSSLMKQPRFAELPFFYGWVIVGLGTLSTTFWMGILTNFSVFFVALLEESHRSRGGTAGVQSTALLKYTVMTSMVGGLIDRFGPKKTVVPEVVFLSAGLALCSQIHSLLTLYIYCWVVVVAGFAFISIVAYFTILSYWFERRRGVVSGLAVLRMGLGTFLLVPLSQYLINRQLWYPACLYGWRGRARSGEHGQCMPRRWQEG